MEETTTPLIVCFGFKTGVVISDGRYYTLTPVERPASASASRNGRVAGGEDPDLPPPRSPDGSGGYEDLGENAHVMVLRKAAYAGGHGAGAGKSTCALKGE